MHFSRGIIKLKYLYRGQKKVRATCRTEHETNKKKNYTKSSFLMNSFLRFQMLNTNYNFTASHSISYAIFLYCFNSFFFGSVFSLLFVACFTKHRARLISVRNGIILYFSFEIMMLEVLDVSRGQIWRIMSDQNFNCAITRNHLSA